MTCLQQIRARKDSTGDYASREDFCRIFTENLNGLYRLSYVLTGDKETAQLCFCRGLEDCLKTGRVFKDSAHSWAKRSIVRNAINALHPQPADSVPSLPDSEIPQKSKLRIIRDQHLEIDSVLALEDFERFVFAMTVLECYSDCDSALLIGCSIGELRAARIRAFQEIAKIVCTDSCYEVSVGQRSGGDGRKTCENHHDNAAQLDLIA